MFVLFVCLFVCLFIGENLLVSSFQMNELEEVNKPESPPLSITTNCISYFSLNSRSSGYWMTMKAFFELLLGLTTPNQSPTLPDRMKYLILAKEIGKVQILATHMLY